MPSKAVAFTLHCVPRSREELVKIRFRFSRSKKGMSFHISHQLPGDVDALKRPYLELQDPRDSS